METLTAATILAAAARVMNPKHERAFLSDVARALNVDVATLAPAVWAMHKRRELSATRCDLVQAFPYETIKASEYRPQGSVTVHWIAAR